jgi:hypothetical protein
MARKSKRFVPHDLKFLAHQPLCKPNLAAVSSEHLTVVTQGPWNRDQGVAESLMLVPDVHLRFISSLVFNWHDAGD